MKWGKGRPLRSIYPVLDKLGIVDVWFHARASTQRLVVPGNLEIFSAGHEDIRVELVELPEKSYDKQVQRAAHPEVGLADGASRFRIC